MIELRTLGSVKVRHMGSGGPSPVDLQPKRLATLVYLAADRPGGLHARETLLALFWPELDAEHARAALRKSLYHLRGKLGREAVVSRGPQVGVDHEYLRCDAVRFREALDTGHREEALRLYRGDFLAGFHISDASGFERWLDAERRHLKREAVAAARALSDEAQQTRERADAVRWARRATEIDPLDERAARRLLEALDEAGDRTAAVRAYEALRERMRESLGLDPAPETRELMEEIRRRRRPVTAARTEAPGPSGEAPFETRAAISPAERRPIDDGSADGPSPPSALRRAADTGRVWRVATATLVLTVVATAAAFFWSPERATPDARNGNPSARPTPDRSVAVLPFENLGPGDGDEYFVRGMHEAVLTSLASLEDLVVTSPASVRSFETRTRPPASVARELGVAHLLVGGVQRTEDRVRVITRLLKAETGRQLWAEQFERPLSAEEVFDIQNRVARAVASALDASLSPEESRRLARRPTDAIDAYDYYLRGRERLGFIVGEWMADRDELDQAIGLFREALEREPDFALAHAGLAQSYAELAEMEGGDPWRDSIRAAADRALRLDPRLAEARLALAEYYRAGLGPENLRSYLQEIRQALELRPNDPRASLEVARGWWRAALSGTARLDQVYCWLKQAARLEPTDPELQRGLAFGARALGDYAAAEAAARSALKLEPDAPRIYRLLVAVSLSRDDRPGAMAYYESARNVASASDPDLAALGMMETYLGQLDSARVHLEAISEYFGRRWSQEQIAFAYALWETGARERAGEILDAREASEREALARGVAGFYPALNLARVLAVRADIGAAVDAMEEAVERGWLYHTHIDPELDGPMRKLWDDPRFDALMTSVSARVDSMRNRARRAGCESVRELPDPENFAG